MARDDWYERLEAYLDGELDRVDTAAFEAETAADPALQSALDERRAFRAQARRALSADLPADLADLAVGLGRQTRTRNPRRHRRWQAVALAATLAAAVLAPSLLRNRSGAEGPRSITMAGPVAAVRFGEQPDATVVLEAGCFDLAAGSCR